MQRRVEQVQVSESVIRYILKLVNASREPGAYPNPLSPRASRALLQGAKAWAFMFDRDYVTPDDVQAVFEAITAHRLNGTSQPSVEGASLCKRLFDSVDPLAA